MLVHDNIISKEEIASTNSFEITIIPPPQEDNSSVISKETLGVLCHLTPIYYRHTNNKEVINSNTSRNSIITNNMKALPKGTRNIEDSVAGKTFDEIYLTLLEKQKKNNIGFIEV